MSQELAAVLDELSARFGATGAELWAELVRYQVASALAGVVAWPVITAFMVWAGMKCMKLADGDDMSGWVFVAIVAGVAGVICGIVSVAAVHDLVATLAAPQAATIRDLLP